MSNTKAMLEAVQSQGIVKIFEAKVNAALSIIAKAVAKKGNTPSWQVNNPANDAIEDLLNIGGIMTRLDATGDNKLDVNAIVKALGDKQPAVPPVQIDYKLLAKEVVAEQDRLSSS